MKPKEKTGSCESGKRAPNWTIDETIVLVYFRRRGVCWKGCCDLILLKCGRYRTPRSADHRLRYLMRSQPLDQRFRNEARQWDIERVNRWVAENLRNLGQGTELVDLGWEERDIVRKVPLPEIFSTSGLIFHQYRAVRPVDQACAQWSR